MARDIVRREKDMEALICIEMMEREDWQWSDRKGRPVVLYLLRLDLINYATSVMVKISSDIMHLQNVNFSSAKTGGSFSALLQFISDNPAGFQ